MGQSNSQETIYAFIDSQNLNLGIQRQGWRLDFERFRVYLKDKYKVEKAFLFIGYIESNQSLYEKLDSYGYILIYKPTVHVRKGGTKGNVDAELILHAMHEINNYDKAVLVSGDGDFLCLVEYLHERDKLLCVVIPNYKMYSSLLLPYKHYLRFTTDLRNKLEKK